MSRGMSVKVCLSISIFLGWMIIVPDFVTVTARSSTLVTGSLGALGEAPVGVRVPELSKESA